MFPINSPSDVLSIKPLADSIVANGIIEPLIIRKNSLKRFEVVSGNRRLKAAITVGLRRVPCILINADDLSASLISISENLNRISPDYFEQAELFKRISNRFGVDYETIAEKTGMSISSLLNRINLLSLGDQVRKKLVSAGLDEKYAVIVSMVPEEKQLDFIEKIVSLSLTPEKAKETLQSFILPMSMPKSSNEEPFTGRKSVACDVRIFSNSLSKLIKTLNNSGISAYSDVVEKEDCIEYTIKIPKPKPTARTGAQKQINPICSFVP
ncbi:MAG: ParB/RepB/Spo0J family partition protein [Clostridia bacterium]|nr:ParB/RepB/Spo0J family partition protein [Clostridia bacterium]